MLYKYATSDGFVILLYQYLTEIYIYIPNILLSITIHNYIYININYRR